MAKTLALIHTVGELVPTFKALCAEMMPDVCCFHVCDEGIIRTLTPEKELTSHTALRMAELVARAENDGADVVLVTCSSISPIVDLVRPLVDVPILKIDEAMADLAIQTGHTIGVLTTARSAMLALTTLVKNRAAVQGKEIQVTTLFLDGVIEILQSGEGY